MSRLEFLGAEWVERFNADIRAEPRNVVALPETRLRLRISDAPAGVGGTFVLDVDEGRPLLVAEGPVATARVTAEVELAQDVARQMLVEGDMLAGLRACEGPDGLASGRRETLLYFLYHLFPGGPEGAHQTAAMVSSYTA